MITYNRLPTIVSILLLFLASCAPGGSLLPSAPAITLSINPQVIFETESATLSWEIQNAVSAEYGTDSSSSDLVVDTTQTAGTKPGGGGVGQGGMPPGALTPMNSSTMLSGAPQGHRHEVWRFSASSSDGQTTENSVWLDVLAVPQFSQCDQTRVTEIINAIRTVDALLRNGCLANNTGLDQSIPAFAQGYLDRTQLNTRLLTELENADLLTFTCKDVTDGDWAAGRWHDHTNEIELEWSPNNLPYLEYVILHELTHKAGFNGDLASSLTAKEIEEQTHQVDGVCFPKPSE